MFHKRHPPVGARPGTLVIDDRAPKPVIRVIDYSESTVDEAEIADVRQLVPYLERSSVTWIDVQGLGDEAVLRQIAELLAFHPLLLEDVVNVPQRPKVEAYQSQLLIVGRMARVPDGGAILREQVTVCVGEGYVITFQEQYGDVFDPVRERIRKGQGRPIRRSGPDYLAYALLDTSIDAYYPVLESVGDRLEELEDDVVSRPGRGTLQQIFAIKRELLELRRAVWPQREALAAMARDELPFLTDGTRLYLRDTYDHCVQIIDVFETYRELAGGLVDVYLSSLSNRMNEVMKVLTIMASIFIPMTFIAGVYGMNFEGMPELHYHLGYPIALTIMAVVAGGMLLYFWRQGWIGSKDPGPGGPPS